MYVCVERQMIETQRETEREKREGGKWEVERARARARARERENEVPWGEERHLFPARVAACILGPWLECWPEEMTKIYEDI